MPRITYRCTDDEHKWLNELADANFNGKLSKAIRYVLSVGRDSVRVSFSQGRKEPAPRASTSAGASVPHAAC